MSVLLRDLFSLLCGQNPGHTWSFAGDLFPVCQRCAGIYAGAAIAAMLLLGFRPRPTRVFLWIHALAILQIVPMGLGLFSQGPALRAVSGEVFALGLVGLLRLPCTAHRPRRLEHSYPRWGLYPASAMASLAMVPALGASGAAVAGSLLAILAVAGLASLVLLAAADLVSILTTRRAGARTKTIREPNLPPP